MKLVILLLLAVRCFGAVALDQSAFNNCSSQCAGTPPAQSVTLNATAGSVVVIYIFWCSNASCQTGLGAPVTGDIASVSDGVDTVAPSLFCTNAAPEGSLFASKMYYIQSANGGTQTLTVTYNILSNAFVGYYGFVAWMSFTGLATSSVLDQTGCGSSNNTAGATSTATTSGNLAQSNELVTAFGVDGALTVGSGFTGVNSRADGAIKDEYQVTGTAGNTVSATFTHGSAQWLAEIATFKTPQARIPRRGTTVQ